MPVQRRDPWGERSAGSESKTELLKTGNKKAQQQHLQRVFQSMLAVSSLHLGGSRGEDVPGAVSQQLWQRAVGIRTV